LASSAALPADDRYFPSSAFEEGERASLYTPDFRASVPLGRAQSIMRDRYLRSDADDEVNRQLDLDVQTYLGDGLLFKMDIASMAHSLEVRSPLLDQQLMQFAASLPGAWKVQRRQTKVIFKQAVAPWLPADTLRRKKRGFTVPLATWIRGPLRSLPEDVLLDRRCIDRGIFRAERVRRMIDDHVAGVRDNADKLWTLIQLELWFQTFVDNHPRGPLALSVTGYGSGSGASAKALSARDGRGMP
jgi:asparagine synthase (glutamine-hydrolysing)